MSRALERRIARLERVRNTRGDWRQFGDDAREKPDWALVASLLWHYEQDSQLRDDPRVNEVRRLSDLGETDAAFQALGSLYRARLQPKALQQDHLGHH
jgi:hypothetical protein